MKKLLLVTTMTFALLSFKASNDDFCRGWSHGFQNGWKHVKGDWSLPPLTPLCPFPKVGEDKYTHGYNRGFQRGVYQANESR